MTETRPPYQSTAIKYPGSRLEILIECLDEIAELTPETYPLRVSSIHRELQATLEGEIGPMELMAYLMSSSGGQSK